MRFVGRSSRFVSRNIQLQRKFSYRLRPQLLVSLCEVEVEAMYCDIITQSVAVSRGIALSNKPRPLAVLCEPRHDEAEPWLSLPRIGALMMALQRYRILVARQIHGRHPSTVPEADV